MRKEVMKIIENEHKITSAAVVLFAHFCVAMMLVYNRLPDVWWGIFLYYLFAWPFALLLSLFYVPIRNMGIRRMPEYDVDLRSEDDAYSLKMATKEGVPYKVYTYMATTEAALCVVVITIISIISK